MVRRRMGDLEIVVCHHPRPLPLPPHGSSLPDFFFEQVSCACALGPGHSGGGDSLPKLTTYLDSWGRS